jgi:hypothetical protein
MTIAEFVLFGVLCALGGGVVVGVFFARCVWHVLPPDQTDWREAHARVYRALRKRDFIIFDREDR